MGKLHSKHVLKREGPEGECILVNTQITSGSNTDRSDTWSDINLQEQHSIISYIQSTVKQDVSISIDNGTMPVGFADDRLPLRVVLPPTKEDKTGTKILTMDADSLCKKRLDSETTDDNNKSKLNVEEFECGVSLAGSDKQEWSFTLYDFDGHGKVTKEDLGQLLKSLYDTVGSSINLQQSGGSKTIRLHLTVSPDQAKIASDPDTKENNLPPKEDNRAKVDKHSKEKDNNKLTKENMKQNNLSDLCEVEKFLCKELSGKDFKNHHRDVKNNNLSSPGKTPEKPRLSRNERRHLADLVQQNMERHQVRTQHLRRHNSDHQHHHHRSRRRPKDKESTPTCQESQERRNYYLDLAGIENDNTASRSKSHDLHNQTAPAEVLQHSRSHDHQSKLRSRSHSARAERCDKHPHHFRSRSHDQTIILDSGVVSVKPSRCVQERIVEETAEEQEVEEQEVLPPKMASTPKQHKVLRPVSLPPHIPEAASPHHHRRHRHRDRNRKLAMQQVAQWIEREHSWSCDPAEGGDLAHTALQRHEHHHIHEHHHHHHYHHYHET